MIGRARLLDPLEPRGPYYEGIIALLRGDAGQAEQLFLSALELRSDYAPALGRLSWLNWRRSPVGVDRRHTHRVLPGNRGDRKCQAVAAA
jgi:hypothetical protein